ncbi:MAG: amidohydrolase [Nitrospirae bacterium]|nr:MAG: amidohydrolase [Nitrospirota bacterium]
MPHRSLNIAPPASGDDAAVTAWLAAEAGRLGPVLTTLRRTLHQRPERGGEEVQTAALVTGVLEGLGLPVRTGIAGHGVVALVEGGRPGPTVALRADMDALGIQDEKRVPYRSQVPDTAHACGHDAHTACSLGAAILLAHLADHLPGRVKLIFQPAEEVIGRGANEMIAAGVMEDPKVEAIFGLHCQPHLHVGQVGVRRGVMMAAGDFFTVEIEGRSGHAARPEEAIDTVLVAAQAVCALHQVVPRAVSIHEPVVLTVGAMHAGISANVIPGRATLAGTVRTLDNDTRLKVREVMEQVLDGTCRTLGARFRLDYLVGAPPVVNDPALTELLAAAAAKVVGPENVVEIEEPSMGGEDFSCYQELAPGSYFRLGTANEDPATHHPLHHACFDIDERALPLGAQILAQAAWDYLRRAA